MVYQETGRFGRITKHLRNQGFEKVMEDILFDSGRFSALAKPEQTKYVETVIARMDQLIGETNTEKVLFECGAQCCGKSWSNFARRIWDRAESTEDFFIQLNAEEEQYNTQITHDSDHQLITVTRSECICGLINKGAPFLNNRNFCKCSIGHMSVFFNTIFEVTQIELKKAIYAGDERCEWKIKIAD